jgi:hypothetical protein
MRSFTNLLKNKSFYYINRFHNTKLNKLIKNELPKDEENLDLLLKEMNRGETSSNISFNQKDDIIHISSEKFEKIKLGECIKFNNKHFAQCVAIKENLVTLMLMDRLK